LGYSISTSRSTLPRALPALFRLDGGGVFCGGRRPFLDGRSRGEVGSCRQLKPSRAAFFVKNLFWEPEECAVEYYPPAWQYVRANPYRLHLWRPLTRSLANEHGIPASYPPVGCF
jgi:hypothetical protein